MHTFTDTHTLTHSHTYTHAHPRIETNYTVTNVWNVVAKVEGQVEKDRLIILGG